jgi:hypothetical protein
MAAGRLDITPPEATTMLRIPKEVKLNKERKREVRKKLTQHQNLSLFLWYMEENAEMRYKGREKTKHKMTERMNY